MSSSDYNTAAPTANSSNVQTTLRVPSIHHRSSRQNDSHPASAVEASLPVASTIQSSATDVITSETVHSLAEQQNEKYPTSQKQLQEEGVTVVLDCTAAPINQLSMVWITQGKTDHAAFVLKELSDGRKLVKWTANEQQEWIGADLPVKTELPRRRRGRRDAHEIAVTSQQMQTQAAVTRQTKKGERAKHQQQQENNTNGNINKNEPKQNRRRSSSGIKGIGRKNKKQHRDPKYAVATEVSKEFPPDGWFSGKVVQILKNGSMYKVVYEDDDVEQLTEKQIDGIVVGSSKLPASVVAPAEDVDIQHAKTAATKGQVTKPLKAANAIKENPVAANVMTEEDNRKIAANKKAKETFQQREVVAPVSAVLSPPAQLRPKVTVLPTRSLPALPTTTASSKINNDNASATAKRSFHANAIDSFSFATNKRPKMQAQLRPKVAPLPTKKSVASSLLPAGQPIVARPLTKQPDAAQPQPKVAPHYSQMDATLRLPRETKASLVPAKIAEPLSTSIPVPPNAVHHQFTEPTPLVANEANVPRPPNVSLMSAEAADAKPRELKPSILSTTTGNVPLATLKPSTVIAASAPATTATATATETKTAAATKASEPSCCENSSNQHQRTDLVNKQLPIVGAPQQPQLKPPSALPDANTTRDCSDVTNSNQHAQKAPQAQLVQMAVQTAENAATWSKEAGPGCEHKSQNPTVPPPAPSGPPPDEETASQVHPLHISKGQSHIPSLSQEKVEWTGGLSSTKKGNIVEKYDDGSIEQSGQASSVQDKPQQPAGSLPLCTLKELDASNCDRVDHQLHGQNMSKAQQKLPWADESTGQEALNHGDMPKGGIPTDVRGAMHQTAPPLQKKPADIPTAPPTDDSQAEMPGTGSLRPIKNAIVAGPDRECMQQAEDVQPLPELLLRENPQLNKSKDSKKDSYSAIFAESTPKETQPTEQQLPSHGPTRQQMKIMSLPGNLAMKSTADVDSKADSPLQMKQAFDDDSQIQPKLMQKGATAGELHAEQEVQTRAALPPASKASLESTAPQLPAKKSIVARAISQSILCQQSRLLSQEMLCLTKRPQELGATQPQKWPVLQNGLKPHVPKELEKQQLVAVGDPVLPQTSGREEADQKFESTGNAVTLAKELLQGAAANRTEALPAKDDVRPTAYGDVDNDTADAKLRFERMHISKPLYLGTDLLEMRRDDKKKDLTTNVLDPPSSKEAAAKENVAVAVDHAGSTGRLSATTEAAKDAIPPRLSSQQGSLTRESSEPSLVSLPGSCPDQMDPHSATLCSDKVETSDDVRHDSTWKALTCPPMDVIRTHDNFNVCQPTATAHESPPLVSVKANGKPTGVHSVNEVKWRMRSGKHSPFGTPDCHEPSAEIKWKTNQNQLGTATTPSESANETTGALDIADEPLHVGELSVELKSNGKQVVTSSTHDATAVTIKENKKPEQGIMSSKQKQKATIQKVVENNVTASAMLKATSADVMQDTHSTKKAVPKRPAVEGNDLTWIIKESTSVAHLLEQLEKPSTRKMSMDLSTEQSSADQLTDNLQMDNHTDASATMSPATKTAFSCSERRMEMEHPDRNELLGLAAAMVSLTESIQAASRHNRGAIDETTTCRETHSGDSNSFDSPLENDAASDASCTCSKEIDPTYWAGTDGVEHEQPSSEQPPQSECCPVCGEHIQALAIVPIDWTRLLQMPRDKVALHALMSHTETKHNDEPIWNAMGESIFPMPEQLTPTLLAKYAIRKTVELSYPDDTTLMDLEKLRDFFVRRMGLARGYVLWGCDELLSSMTFQNDESETMISNPQKMKQLTIQKLSELEDLLVTNTFVQNRGAMRQFAQSQWLHRWRNLVQLTFLSPDGIESHNDNSSP